MILLVWILITIILFLLFFTKIASESPKDDSTGSISDTFLIASHSPVISTYRLSENPDERALQEFTIYRCERFGVSPSLALAIISCEGGFSNAEICNKKYGCSGGMGAWQFIPSTWSSTIERMNELLPVECRSDEAVFDSKCNLLAGVWLLSTDGERHWRNYSGSCYLRL